MQDLLSSSASSHRDSLREIIRRGRIHFRDEDTLDPESFRAYGRDRTTKFEPDFQVLIQPADTQETAELVRYAYANRINLVPSGGRTGLAGGALARQGEIVVSLERMNRLLDFDPFLPALRVEAGMITAELQNQARERGLYYPVDFAASGSSTIGGNIATNAGGIHVIKYGMTRDWTLGLTLVTGTGEILRMNGPLLKNNTGPDLRHLVIGSEGILGFITEAILRLAAPPGESEVLLLALDDFAATPMVLRKARESGLDLLAFEYFDDACLEIVREHLDLPKPFRQSRPHYILTEFIRAGDEADASWSDFLEKAATVPGFHDAVRAESSAARKNFWSYREAISESLSLGGAVHKNDVSLPIPEMENFISRTRKLLEQDARDIEAVFFGHIGDGNLHVNLRKPENLNTDDFHDACEELDTRVYEMIREAGGSVSAEHGIGILKKDFLEYSRSPGEIRMLREIKKIFDPAEIMNPGKLI